MSEGLEREDHRNNCHENVERCADVDWHRSVGLWLVSVIVGNKIERARLTFATVAMTALKIPIIRLNPIAIPFPVPLWALGSTSGVYA